MSENVCISCRRSKEGSPCEVCLESICSDCEQFLDASTFSFLKKIPDELAHSRYCQTCFAQKVEPALESYQKTMAQAEKLYVFFHTQKKAIPVIRRSKEAVRVEQCDDRDETILRLAFFAAEQDYNAIIETEVISDKIRNAGYQKKRWRGSAIPALVDEKKVDRFD